MPCGKKFTAEQNRKILPEHESQMTRPLIPAFTEEGLLYPDRRPWFIMVASARSHRVSPGACRRW
jgi:hypothetical protein